MDVLGSVVIFSPAGLILLALLARQSFRGSLGALAVLLLFLLDSVFLKLTAWAPDFDIVRSSWNWEGKLAAFAFAAAACMALPAQMRAQIGLFRGPHLARWRLLCAAVTLHLMLASLRGFFFGDAAAPDWHTLAYQASMPGFHEELTYRGLWWVLLAYAIDPGRTDAGKIPWRTLAVTTILFASVHAIAWDAVAGITFEPLYFVATGLSALLFGLMQALGRSVWVPVIAHNAGNVIILGWPMFLPIDG